MAIHIGELIQKEVEAKRLTYKEFGALIHRNEKTIPDIYDRATMSIDLLIIISKALKKDFLRIFYTEEPMKSLQEGETVECQHQFKVITEQVKVLTEKAEYMAKELAHKQEFIELQKNYLALAIEWLVDFKKKSGYGVVTGDQESNRAA